MNKVEQLEAFVKEMQDFVDSKPDWFKQMAEYYSPDFVSKELPKLKVVKDEHG